MLNVVFPVLEECFIVSSKGYESCLQFIKGTFTSTSKTNYITWSVHHACVFNFCIFFSSASAGTSPLHAPFFLEPNVPSTSSGAFGSAPISFPHFQHPSHELLKKNGFTQQLYHKFRQKCFKGKNNFSLALYRSYITRFLLQGSSKIWVLFSLLILSQPV